MHWVVWSLPVTPKVSALSELTELNLCYNEMTARSARLISAVLGPKSSLISVHLNGNEFGDSGVAALSVFSEYGWLVLVFSHGAANWAA